MGGKKSRPANPTNSSSAATSPEPITSTREQLAKMRKTLDTLTLEQDNQRRQMLRIDTDVERHEAVILRNGHRSTRNKKQLDTWTLQMEQELQRNKLEISKTVIESTREREKLKTSILKTREDIQKDLTDIIKNVTTSTVEREDMKTSIKELQEAMKITADGIGMAHKALYDSQIAIKITADGIGMTHKAVQDSQEKYFNMRKELDELKKCRKVSAELNANPGLTDGAILLRRGDLELNLECEDSMDQYNDEKEGE